MPCTIDPRTAKVVLLYNWSLFWKQLDSFFTLEQLALLFRVITLKLLTQLCLQPCKENLLQHTSDSKQAQGSGTVLKMKLGPINTAKWNCAGKLFSGTSHCIAGSPNMDVLLAETRPEWKVFHCWVIFMLSAQPLSSVFSL